MTKTVLILGASGRIGSHAATAFWNAGWTVRRYERGTDMSAAALGADVIVNGLNPPNYHNWAEVIPAITRQVIDAAMASGATVILPGNVYNFGNTPGTWDEATPQEPVSRKGRLRKEMEAAYRASGIQTIVLRAGSFIDPDRNGCAMTLMHLREIDKGRVSHMGDPDCLHAFCYLPDWARAAVMLADRREMLESFQDIPFEGHAFTIRDLKDHLEAALGKSLRLTAFPWWIMSLTAPVWELARELKEMRYLWHTPHALSGARLRQILPEFDPSPTGVVMEAALPADIRPDEPVRACHSAALAAQ